MQTLKLLQLNIEGSRHLDLIIPFLDIQESDAVCLQELNEPDIPRFEEALGMKCFFAPMNLREDGSKHGVGIFAAQKHNTRVFQYGGSFLKELPLRDASNKQRQHDTKRFVVAFADIEKDGELFRIGTTHFPVTDHGAATDFQREDMKNLLAILAKEGEFVLTGDFNAPRGQEIFSMLAAKYKDNIPQHITTSLHYGFHRTSEEALLASARALGLSGLMVDGVFSTPGYTVSNVEGHTGVSDHWAFTADIKRVEI